VLGGKASAGGDEGARRVGAWRSEEEDQQRRGGRRSCWGKTWGRWSEEESTLRRMRRRSQEGAAKPARPPYLRSSDSTPVPCSDGCFPGRILAMASAAGRDTSSRWGWQETSERRVSIRSRLRKALQEVKAKLVPPSRTLL